MSTVALSMSFRRSLRLALAPLLLLAVTAAVWLATLVLRRTWEVGAAEAWMMAWVLAFVIALPLAMLALPLLAKLQQRLRRTAIVPFMGEKIPGAGQ